MTQEEKRLLLQDLCARLPYGVKVTTRNPAAEFGVISGISIKGKISVGTKDADIVFECTEVKPFLRPMSSMTEEEDEELCSLSYTQENDEFDDESDDWITRLYYYPSIESIDWLNAHHFDYRHLIERGLAIEVTKENNPYKNLILL